MESESEFPTAILTSKSPQDVARFLPHSLQMSSKLIEKNLHVWFANYANMIARYNHDLNALVANGRDFFADANGEFGSLDKIWNCIALLVMSQVHVNDALIRAIKTDVLHPFAAAFKDDFRFSELLVNSDELAELLSDLADGNGEYNWNVKAPAILANFENYKKFEKSLIFNAFISYLNVLNHKTAGLVSKNENAVNFILKEFHIDNEMALYTERMIRTNVPETDAEKHARADKNKPKAPTSRPTASSRASFVSSASSTGSSPTKDKRKSKLRSKMGSILGRKKKNTSVAKSEPIPEDGLLVSAPSRLDTFASRTETRSSLYNAPNRVSRLESVRDAPAPREPAAKEAGETGNAAVPVAAGAAAAGAAVAGVSQPFQHTFDAKPLQPTQPEPKQAPPAPLYLEAAQPEEESNFEKYSSSDESDVPTDRTGNRMSLLNAHDLGQPPKVDNDSESRSRKTSSGKYSFEYGDEAKSLSTPQTPVVPPPAANIEPTIPETTGESSNPLPGAFEQPEHSTRPPPPPSRKVHSTGTTRDLASGTHSVRDSFVPPQGSERMSLISQTTGNSLLRQDVFKHFGSGGLIREGLNTSVAEIINVVFSGDLVQKAQVLGEIAFNYNSQQPVESLDVRIPSKFSRFLLNDNLLAQKSPEVFAIHVPAITGKTLGGIKYSMDIDKAAVPLVVKQIWKFEPHQASLIIKLSLNPAYGETLKLENFAISAALDEATQSTSASSKPEGSFNKDMNRIIWRYTEPLQFTAAAPEMKFIARIMTNGLGKEAALGVKLRFTAENSPSFVSVMNMAGENISSISSLSSGNYTSHA